MPLFKCIDSTHRRPQSFVLLACWSLKKFQNIENWTLFWQSNPWMHLTKSESEIFIVIVPGSTTKFVFARPKRTPTYTYMLISTCTLSHFFKNTLKQTKLQTYCSFWRPERIGEFHPFYCHSQWQRNLIWQANVVTDSLSGAFYGSSMLLVNPSPRHSRQHTKVDLPYLLLSFTLMLKSFPSCIIPECAGF